MSINREEALKQYRTIKTSLENRIAGQEGAKKVLLSYIKNYVTGVHDKNSPIGSFMATGPTGVGKTEVANVLSEVLFDKKPIRFDMNEFGEENAKRRLIGVPPGKQGAEAGGQLTRALLGEGLNEEPEPAVLLFDEIEKAHPKIYDVFLRIFDEGAYQDQNGLLVDCTKTLIFLTSNVDQEIFEKNIKSDRDSHTEVDEALKKEVRDEDEARQEAVDDEFRTEFINRLDDVLYFDPLDKQDLMEIMKLKFSDFRQEIEEELGLTVRITQQAMKLVINRVYNIRFGARPLDDGINQYIRRALSDHLLSQDESKGVHFKVQDGEIVTQSLSNSSPESSKLEQGAGGER